MYKLIKPLLFRIDPETAHHAVRVLGTVASLPLFSNLLNPIFNIHRPILRTTVAGINFDNPVGLAAGYDKNGEMLKLMQTLGFGFLEIGSVTARPSRGNPKPRLFRLPEDNALINRIGLSNHGVDSISKRLLANAITIPVGVNIAKTNDSAILGDRAIDDYLYSYKLISGCCDYVVLNISCPNTSDGKTFEDTIYLAELLSAIRSQPPNGKPLFLKLSADLSNYRVGSILETAKRYAVDGYIISNTSIERTNLRTVQDILSAIGAGGLSGAPIRKRSTELIRYIYNNFEKPAIIGVGGIFSAEDAFEKIRAGASLVQLYTALVYQGPFVVKKINQGLARLLALEGFSSISQAVGSLSS